MSDKFRDSEGFEGIREGYFYRATGGHNWYYIFLTIDENHVEVEVRKECDIVINSDYGILENGDKHEYSAYGDLLFSIDIWAKYFYPTFNEDANQFYHGDGTDEDIGCMKAMFEVFEFAYDLALKESGIKPY